MRVEDFGFTPEVGKKYSVSFTQNNELLYHIVYEGADLGALKFKDNSTVTLSITDYETGKLLMTTDFVAYNGQLYKKVFKLALQDDDSNMNSNVHIKDLHYDLTTASVLVQVQGFTGEKYKLVVSGTTTDLPSIKMNLELEDDMHYSIPTQLVQNDQFTVTLFDEYDTELDVITFTAPISTDWRFNESNEVALEDEGEEGPSTLVPVDVTEPTDATGEELPADGGEPVEETPTDTTEELPVSGDLTSTGTLDDSMNYEPVEEPGLLDSIYVKVGIGVVLLLILALIIKKLKKPKQPKQQPTRDNSDDDFDESERYEDFDDGDDDSLDVVSGVISSPASHRDDDDLDDGDDPDDLIMVDDDDDDDIFNEDNHRKPNKK